MSDNFFSSRLAGQQGHHIYGPEYVNFINNNEIFDRHNFQGLKPETESQYTYGEYSRMSNGENIDVSDFGYKLNKSGHRCDDFTTNHQGHHVLFAGDSFTFGEALPYKQYWSGMMYEYLNKEIGLSGYFSLGYAGGSVDLIINNLYNYIDEYGSPDQIYMLLPDSYRHFLWHMDRFVSAVPYSPDRTLYWKNDQNYRVNAYSKIKNFERYCKALGVQLFWSSWSSEDRSIYNDLDFSNYIDLSDSLIFNNIDSHRKNDKYADFGRDGTHPGTKYHSGVYNIYRRKYEDFKKNN